MAKYLLDIPDSWMDLAKTKTWDVNVNLSDGFRYAIGTWLFSGQPTCGIVMSGGCVVSGSILMFRIG